jgi:serine/threonine protein kinase
VEPDSKRWQKIKAIFEAAMELEPAHRAAYLDQQCEGDPDLRANLDSLIEQNRIAGSFMQGPAIAAGALRPLIKAAPVQPAESDTKSMLNATPVSSQPFDETKVFPAEDVCPGAILKSRYLIVRELSRGGFGTVYFAHDQQLHGKPVVVKVQLNNLGDDPWFERKFSEEIRALALIDHPGVVGALDHGKTAGGKPFLVMQYVEGQRLRGVMAPEGMPLDSVADIVRQIGRALGAAHDKRVWHRDLKPENIMLQAQSGGALHVRLIDFGISTIEDLQSSHKRAGTRVAGSLGYMAPEQLDGQPSAATDIYAFGVIAYEMITGRKPFLPQDAMQLAGLQRAGVRIKPTDLRADLPPTAQTLILRALAYNPKDRPSNAQEFGEQLARSLVQPSETSQPQHQQALTKHTGLGIAGAVLAAGIVFALVRLYHQVPPQDPPQKEVARKQDGPDRGDQISRETELVYWNSIKDEHQAEPFKAYLSKYPVGQFAELAKLKLAMLAAGPPKNDPKNVIPKEKKPTPPEPAEPSLPSPRAPLRLEEYGGPLHGLLQWSGRLSPQKSLTIQAGHVLSGSLHNDLPRVPITVELETQWISVVEAPSAQNHWDRIVLRNDSTGEEVDGVVVRWSVIR